MFFDEPVVPVSAVASPDVSAGLAINGLAVVLLGVFPGMIMASCLAAFS